MSESLLYVVEPSGEVILLEEYQNSHGYAIPAWRCLAEKYLRKPGESDEDFFKRWWLTEECKGVWALKNDPRVERFEHIALMASYDHAVVKKENFQEVVEAFEKIEQFYKEMEPGNVCHYGAMAQAIKKLGPDIIGITWGSSMGQDLWDVNDSCECPTCGTSHTMDESRPYNIKKDKDHWFLFEKLELLLNQDRGSQG